jgi:hypothetical protein
MEKGQHTYCSYNICNLPKHNMAPKRGAEKSIYRQVQDFRNLIIKVQLQWNTENVDCTYLRYSGSTWTSLGRRFGDKQLHADAFACLFPIMIVCNPNI